MTPYLVIWRNIWRKRGRSEACLDRMQELYFTTDKDGNLVPSGIGDAKMIEIVRAENLW